MRKFIASLILILFALTGIVHNPAVVSGQEDPDTLLAISDDETLTDEERFSKAKDGLVLALNLAKEKVAELTASLNEREFDEESRETDLRASFLIELQGYDIYYSENLEAAGPLLTLLEIQALALEVKTYRDEVYTPKVEDIVQFILVFYSEDVIGIATDRFTKISEDIDTLESLGLIKRDSFDEQMQSVESLLNEARDLTAVAKEFLLRAPAENDIVAEAIEEPEVENATTTDDVEEVISEEEIVDPIEVSLNNVKTSYEVFLEISKSVKATLGID